MEPKSLYEKILQAEKASTIQEITDIENSKQIRVHMPCKVVAINNNGTTVDVEIQGQEDTGFGFYSKFPMLLDLPVIYNNYTSKAYIITPIQVGDTGLVEFLDFNPANFNFDGNTAITTDLNYHTLNNGVFINGYIPQSNVVKDIDIENSAIVIGLHNNTFKMTVDGTGELNIITDNNIKITSGLGVDIDTPSINCSGDLFVGSGASGSFVSQDNKTVVVKNGIVTSIS